MFRDIVITGASSGIGCALSKHLSIHNKVYGISRNRPKIKHQNFHFIKSDLSDLKNINKAISKIKKADVLINNAGTAQTKNKNKFLNFIKIISVNLYAPYILSELLKKKLAQSSYPSIINICSINSHQGFPNNPGYNSSKGGLLALTKSMALDLNKYKIRVNSISPGYIKTNMTKNSFRNSYENKRRLSRMIINRWGEPEDLIGIVELLISKRSS